MFHRSSRKRRRSCWAGCSRSRGNRPARGWVWRPEATPRASLWAPSREVKRGDGEETGTAGGPGRVHHQRRGRARGGAPPDPPHLRAEGSPPACPHAWQHPPVFPARYRPPTDDPEADPGTGPESGGGQDDRGDGGPTGSDAPTDGSARSRFPQGKESDAGRDGAAAVAVASWRDRAAVDRAACPDPGRAGQGVVRPEAAGTHRRWTGE